jgi:cell wall-associated NlpC family hydrolase
MLKRCLILMALAWLPLTAAADDASRPPGGVTPATEEAGMFAQAREFALSALGFIGVRYKWGGSSPDTGFDCSGLIRYVYAQITGQTLPGNAQEISRVGEAVDQSELRPGDLVFFNTLRRPFSHVGIYLGDSRFVHAPSRGGAVEIVDMRQRYWKSRYNGARRLPI